MLKVYLFLKMYFMPMLIFGMLIWLIICQMKKVRWVKWEQSPHKIYREWIKQREDKINQFLRLFSISWAVISLIAYMPAVVDMPAVLMLDSEYDKGEIVKMYNSNELEETDRDIVILNQFGEEESYHIFDCPWLDEGTEVEIRYFKYSKKGFIRIAE